MMRSLIPADMTYGDYLAWQASKAPQEKIVSRWKERKAWFIDRFQSLYSSSGEAVCLGSRYGEEVAALWVCGWLARGIDIEENPPFVDSGDMNMPLPHKAFKLVYTNAFDHCFDAPMFLSNIGQSLKPGGRFMIHISDGRAGKYETIEWDELDDVLTLLAEAGLIVERAEPMPAFYGLTTEIVGRC